MNTARQSVSAPAPPKDKPATPFIFEWYENRIQRDLQFLYREDHGQRQKIVEIIEELHDSNMLWKLMACYQSTVEGADEETKTGALFALLARIYIAGTHRGAMVLE